MKKVLIAGLALVTSSAFAFYTDSLRTQIKEEKEKIAKAEESFSSVCKDSADGYVPCMKRLSFEYRWAVDMLPTLEEELNKEIKAEKAAKAEMAELAKGVKCTGKKGFVSLGMNTKQAIVCGWGKPQRVNRSTNAYGTREQWVYGDRNYLYFTNGVLTSFQN